MPGADLYINIAPNDERGLRSPRHIAYLSRTSPQVLQPFMAHPLRPGETLAGMSIQGQSIVPVAVSLPDAPLCYAEMGMWIVPLSTLDPVFTDLIVAGGEDLAERSVGGATVGGTGVPVAPDPLSAQGHLTPGLQAVTRSWAGEIGGNNAGNAAAGSYYMPYTSFATYKVASDWYDLRTTLNWADNSLFANPPGIEQYIRGALMNNFDAGLVSVDPSPVSGFDLSTLIEQMFLLTSEESTYASYLAAHGINPRKAGGISQPVFLQTGYLNQQSNGQVVSGGNINPVGANNFEQAAVTSTWVGDQINTGDPTVVTDRATFGHLSHTWNERRTRSILVEEPSVLLGTMAYFPLVPAQNDYVAHIDMNRMTHPGHWGNRQGGGVDEEDFLATQQLYTKDGTGLQIGEEADQSGDAVFNMMNLYLHGDYTSIGTDAEEKFRFRQPGGDIYVAANTDLISKLSVQLHIMSDLVAG